MRTLYIIIIVVLGLALIILTIVRNNKDKKDYESNAENDFKKPPVEE